MRETAKMLTLLGLDKQSIDDVIQLLLVDLTDASGWDSGNRPADVSQLPQTPNS